jgi:signal transduction histidine kinase
MSLSARLTVALGALLLAMGLGVAALEITMSSRYYLETTQRLNASLAMYMVERRPIFRGDTLQEGEFRELARTVMSANPAVEVYVLDRAGRILTSGVPRTEWARSTVGLAPIFRFLAGHFPAPLLGDDPRSVSAQRIFSVAEIGRGTARVGYLYVILDGRARQSTAAQARGSYVQTAAVGTIIAATLCLIAIAWLLVHSLTRPLRRLGGRVDAAFGDASLLPREPVVAADELARLSAAFTALEERVRAQMAQLANVDRERRALIAQLSHDLRTPLGVTQGYIESALMRDASLAPAERRELLARAYRQAEALQGLLDDVRALAELEAPDQPLALEAVSLGELGHDVAQGLALFAERHSVGLSIDVTVEDTQVIADLALVQRVLQNLLTNAIKATPPGGRVRLTIGQRADLVHVCVQDEGPGLDPDAQARLTAPTFDWQTTRWHGTERRGLGLLIVGRLLALHGIRASVLRADSAGSAIEFAVPIAPRATSQPVGVAGSRLAQGTVSSAVNLASSAPQGAASASSVLSRP